MTWTWTPEHIEMLTRLWNDGLSTAQIGKMLGVSKNAVVGKAHRLQLAVRNSPIQRKEGAQIIELTANCCRWPEGHPGQPGFRFCGKQALPGKPYCPEHAARAYTQPKDRKSSTNAA